MSETTDRLNRRATDSQISELGRRMTVIEEAQSAGIAQLAENTQITREIQANTKDIVDAWNAMVGGLKVLGFLAKLAKWGTWIAGAAGVVWYFVKTGELPNAGDITPK